MWLLVCFWGLWVWLDGSGVDCWGVLVGDWLISVVVSALLPRFVVQTWEKDLSLTFIRIDMSERHTATKTESIEVKAT